MKNAFSLVELSIVLVILGLLTGGILAGQNLIRAAEMRSVVTEYQGYVTAINTFQDKYFALPGDMANATDFWGSSASCPGTAGTGTQTCNGNSDGSIIVANSASNYNESFTFWQHLANAGLIEGSYTGRAGSASISHSIPAENAPRGRLNNSTWLVTTAANHPGSSTTFAYDYQNFLEIGTATATSWPIDPLLTPEEAWSIDTKMDDGMPGAGNVIGRYWDDLCAAASSFSDHAAPYNLSDTAKRCSLMFARAF